jgi:hypothetical protein
MSLIMMDMIMTTLESIAELFGTTITPFVYRIMYPNDPIESRQLARFAIRVYAISNLIAFLLYPIISGITWIGCQVSMAVSYFFFLPSSLFVELFVETTCTLCSLCFLRLLLIFFLSLLLLFFISLLLLFLQTLVSLVALRTLQYSVVNQIGDAAVQMAKPHWLRTFAGTSMQIPGFQLPGVGCYVRTQTTEDTLR